MKGRTNLPWVQSGSLLTRQLLGFARGGNYEIKPANLNDLIEKTSEVFRRTKKEISVICRLDETLWPVQVDKGQIEQVLLNLYVNAWQAMPGGGELHLQTTNVLLDEEYSKLHSLSAGKFAKISISDNGVGMDENTRKRIFEPFFTTKEMGRGTGLGLATVYGIIDGHKGTINVYSEKGHGTTFNIYLPASDGEVFKGEKETKVISYGKETLLVIDDETIILDVTKELLQTLGYQVITAQNGHEAIEIYKPNSDRIDLILLDMIMPGMSGGETFEALKSLNPDVKVILASGYTQNKYVTDILDKGCRHFVQKPYHLSDISMKIREVLDGPVRQTRI